MRAGATCPTGATCPSSFPGMALLALIQVRLDKVRAVRPGGPPDVTEELGAGEGGRGAALAASIGVDAPVLAVVPEGGWTAAIGHRPLTAQVDLTGVIHPWDDGAVAVPPGAILVHITAIQRGGPTVCIQVDGAPQDELYHGPGNPIGVRGASCNIDRILARDGLDPLDPGRIGRSGRDSPPGSTGPNAKDRSRSGGEINDRLLEGNTLPIKAPGPASVSSEFRGHAPFDGEDVAARTIRLLRLGDG